MKNILIFVLFFVPNFSFADEFSEVFTRINQIRKNHNLKFVSINPKLNQAAQSQANWMAQVGRMDHLREQPSSFEEYKTCNFHPAHRVVNSGYFTFEELFNLRQIPNGVVVDPKPTADNNVNEIIARGVGGPEVYSPARVVNGWMHSPGHKKVILTPHYKEIGVGITFKQGETYWCVVFANRD